MIADCHLNTADCRLGTAAALRIAVVGLVLAVVGLGTACYLGFAVAESRRVFFHAYLTAFAYFLSITLGALFFVMLQHLTRAGWSVTVRRLAEALSGNIWLMLLLFLPVLSGMGEVYQWSHPEDAHGEVRAASQETGTGSGPLHAHGGASASSEASVPAYSKARYLNTQAFAVRFLLYFATWGLLVWLLRSRSIRQDSTGDPRLTASMERISAPGMLAFSFTVMFASVDLLMSQNPHWTSTIFGLYFFTGCVLSSLVALTLLALWFRASVQDGPISVEHLHDLGKLIFGFVFFWGYIAFSQYMLIWYANLPEETQFFIPRQIGPWIWVSVVLLACQLFVPFLGLMSRHAKRQPAVLAFWCVWLLGAHLLDMFWLVMPNLYVQEMPHAAGEAAGTPLPEVFKGLLASNQAVYQLAQQHAGFIERMWLPLGGRSMAVLLALVTGMGGLYLINTVRLLRAAPLAPVGDPRLHEALAFENT
jgi:hypothetical protein